MATKSMTSITSKITVGGVADESSNETSAKVSVIPIARQEVASAKRGSAVEPEHISMDKVDQVVGKLRNLVQTMRRDLNFHIDYATGHVVIRVVESLTNKMVRQIPEEEVLSLAQHLEEILDDIPKDVQVKGSI